MKNILIALLYFFAVQSIAQEQTFKNLLEKPVVANMNKLETLDCRCDNKLVIPVRLPENAKGWFYEVTVAKKISSDEKGAQLLQEVESLSKRISVGDIEKHLRPKETKRNVNVYILNGEEYADSFSRCRFFYHHGKHIRAKSKGGYVRNEETDTYYLGIERNADWKNLEVKVELVAAL